MIAMFIEVLEIFDHVHEGAGEQPTKSVSTLPLVRLAHLERRLHSSHI